MEVENRNKSACLQKSSFYYIPIFNNIVSMTSILSENLP